MASLERVKWAKGEILKTHPKAQVGITSDPKEAGYSLAVRVKTQAEADKIPDDIGGVPIVRKLVGEIHKQSEPSGGKGV